jgi:small multidrug resistance family-3 protein
VNRPFKLGEVKDALGSALIESTFRELSPSRERGASVDGDEREIAPSEGGGSVKLVPWLVFVAAAILEVGGDALVRAGLRGHTIAFVVAGFVSLGTYGLVVNMLRWDFTSLLGSYVAVFAVTSAVFGRFVFGEALSYQSIVGLAIMLLGAVVLQLGR